MILGKTSEEIVVLHDSTFVHEVWEDIEIMSEFQKPRESDSSSCLYFIMLEVD